MPEVHNEFHDHGHRHSDLNAEEASLRVLLDLAEIRHEVLINRSILLHIDRKLMSANDVLRKIQSNLKEAAGEINGKLADLSDQLTENGADPELLGEIQSLSQGLADIVPNAVEADPTVPPLDETPPAETGSDTPVQGGADGPLPPVDSGTPTDAPPAVEGDADSGTAPVDSTNDSGAVGSPDGTAAPSTGDTSNPF